MRINKNIGTKDRKIRFLLSFLFLILSFIFSGLRILFLILALVLGVTATTRFCGLYKIFGVNTLDSKN
jgi:hypothetical protein